MVTASFLSLESAAIVWISTDWPKNLICPRPILSLVRKKYSERFGASRPPYPSYKVGFRPQNRKSRKLQNPHRFTADAIVWSHCKIFLWAYRGHSSLQNEPQNIKIGRGTSENHPIKVDHLHGYQAAIRLSETPNLAQLALTLIRPIFTAIWSWMNFLGSLNTSVGRDFNFFRF